MFLVTLRVKPKPADPRLKGVAGAYVNCWMDLEDIEAAKTTAVRMLADDGWELVGVDEALAITRNRVSAENLAYYDQAFIDKTVLVLHTWPSKDK